MATEQKDNRYKVCLLGPSFDTGNLGVNALVESSIKIIVNRWPDAEVTLLGSGRVDCEYRLKLFDREILVKSMPIRFCKNVFLSNHFLVLFFYAMLTKVFRGEAVRRRLARRNRYLRTIIEADMVADITGGDSFSDIYGMRRFIIGFLRKWLIKLFGKELVLLPQTYGPFGRRMARFLARKILNYATLVYSRDRKGLDDVRKLLGAARADGKTQFVPDVGFLLDPRRSEDTEVESFEEIKSGNGTLVGLNISGLMDCAGEAGNNVFNLRIDYRVLVESIVDSLMRQEGAAVLLVPHVVALHKTDSAPPRNVRKGGYRERSDSVACGRLYERVARKYPGRVFMVRGRYNHNETKYIIGLCDFFIGSRMHACIAAMSQGVPAVGVAYSGKFHGVFESIGVADCVADARTCDEGEIITRLESAFDRREQIREHLGTVMPRIKNRVLSIFDAQYPREPKGVHVE